MVCTVMSEHVVRAEPLAANRTFAHQTLRPTLWDKANLSLTSDRPFPWLAFLQLLMSQYPLAGYIHVQTFVRFHTTCAVSKKSWVTRRVKGLVSRRPSLRSTPQWGQFREKERHWEERGREKEWGNRWKQNATEPTAHWEGKEGGRRARTSKQPTSWPITTARLVSLSLSN